MTLENIARRKALIGAASLLALSAFPAAAPAADPEIHVLKDPDCGCCGAWIEVLEAAGFRVTVELAAAADLMRYKAENGIPEEMSACHTARIAGYVIEGHVPVAEIRRLLDERPDAIGLAVPGMPWGSPGMGPESEREAYDVFLIDRDGGTTVFRRYDAA